MKLYLAGPISLGGQATSIEENIAAFHEAESLLRACGYEIENPANNAEPNPATWENWMRLGIHQLMTCDGIALLPNWQESRGARLELHLAIELGMSQASVRAWAAKEGA